MMMRRMRRSRVRFVLSLSFLSSELESEWGAVLIKAVWIKTKAVPEGSVLLARMTQCEHMGIVAAVMNRCEHVGVVTAAWGEQGGAEGVACFNCGNRSCGDVFCCVWSMGM